MLEKLKEKVRSAKQQLFSFVAASKERVSKCVQSRSLSLLDFLASVLFLSAVVIAVKPELLSPLVNNSMEKIPRVAQTINRAGKYFLQITVREKISDWRIVTVRNCFVLAFLAVYAGLKSAVIVHSARTIHKIMPFLLVSLSLASCALIADKFLLFVLFTLLLFASFEYSIGLSTKKIAKKLVKILINELLLYIIAHLAETKTFREGLYLVALGIAQASKNLFFPVQLW